MLLFQQQHEPSPDASCEPELPNKTLQPLLEIPWGRRIDAARQQPNSLTKSTEVRACTRPCRSRNSQGMPLTW